MIVPQVYPLEAQEVRDKTPTTDLCIIAHPKPEQGPCLTIHTAFQKSCTTQIIAVLFSLLNMEIQ